MKGIFYSTISVLLVLPLVMLAFVNTSFYQSESELETTKMAADKLASFTESVNNDLSRAVEIMAKRSITAAIVHVETTGQPLNDSGDALSELMENGTINGNGSLTDFTVTSWSDILRQKGEGFGFNTSIVILNVSFFSINSYNVGVFIAVRVNVTNPAASMEFHKTYTATIPISIEGFNDPLYALNTNGILKRNIMAPTGPVSGSGNFDNAVENGFYMASQNGAGLLDRLEGRTHGSGKYNISTSMSGLESVVFLPSLQANGITIKPDETTIDYLYFDPASYSGSQVNQSVYSWLKIDSAHASIYNLTTA